VTALTRAPLRVAWTDMPARRHWDPALLLAIGVMLALLALAAYGPLVAPHDFYYVRPLTDGRTPPFPPSVDLPLGSDDSGHDLLSWVLIGARATLLMAVGAASLRMIIGGSLGLMAGWQGGRMDMLLSAVGLAFSSIPGTALAVLGVLIFNLYAGPLAFAVALGLLGWGDAFQQARRHARSEGSRAFIESARAQGMTESRVVLRHLLPSVAPALLTLATLQIAAILLLLGELGLIRLFVGGGMIVDFDDRNGQPSQIAATNPDWSSMLAATRPIVSLYGASHTVLVPGLALLGAVIGINYIGDVLARRAQRLNVYALFTRWQTAAVSVLLVGLMVPALLWPSRLAPDLADADRISGDVGLEIARALASLPMDGRVAGTEGAQAAAALLAEHWRGQLQPVAGSVPTVTEASLGSPRGRVEMGSDLEALSLRTERSVGAPRDLDRDPPTTFRSGAFRGQLVVLTAGSPLIQNIGLLARSGDAAGVLIVSDDLGRFSPRTEYEVPTLRVGTRAFAALTGTLPYGVDEAAAALPDLPMSISVTAGSRPFASANAIVRVPAVDPQAPIVLVLAPFDTRPRPRYVANAPDWATASAAGIASEVLGRVRAHALPAQVIFVATSAEAFESAGTVTFLGSLSTDEARRLLAVVSVGPVTSERPAVLTERTTRNAPASGVGPRVGGRVADALGLRMRPSDLPLSGQLRVAGASAPVFGVSDLITEHAPAPTAAAIRIGARAVQVLVSYLARHPEELRP